MEKQTKDLSLPSDFIDTFMELSEGQFSPDIYRLWSAIALIGGACERRVWTRTGDYDTYLNQYILLVGNPGTGKAIVEKVRDLWMEVEVPGTAKKAFHVSPDSMSKASLMDALARSKQKIQPDGLDGNYEYHSLLVTAEELSLFIPTYDMEFIGVLNALYMNKSVYEETRRASVVKELIIDYPQINLLGGVQPAFLAELLPETAWKSGLSRRLLMVYSGEVKIYDPFFVSKVGERLKGEILTMLGGFASLYGPIHWSPEAGVEFRKWWLTGGEPRPTHSKLTHYNQSRSMFIMKLAGIAQISRTHRVGEISLPDYQRALGWLTSAEKLMPDIFREMVGKSDAQLLEELWFYVTQQYAKRARRPIPASDVWSFLSTRVPSDKLSYIITVAERSGVLGRVEPDDNGSSLSYTPRPKYQHGVE